MICKAGGKELGANTKGFCLVVCHKRGMSAATVIIEDRVTDRVTFRTALRENKNNKNTKNTPNKPIRNFEVKVQISKFNV